LTKVSRSSNSNAATLCASRALPSSPSAIHNAASARLPQIRDALLYQVVNQQLHRRHTVALRIWRTAPPGTALASRNTMASNDEQKPLIIRNVCKTVGDCRFF
jgi:hypothetical protein